MLVNAQQIQDGVVRFVENELASQATGVRKFGLYFIMPVISKKTTDYLEVAKKYTPELFEHDGRVKIDEVYNYAKKAIQRSGQFEFVGIIFNETDIDKLYTYIKGV